MEVGCDEQSEDIRKNMYLIYITNLVINLVGDFRISEMLKIADECFELMKCG